MKNSFRNLARYFFALLVLGGLTAAWAYLWLHHYVFEMAHPFYWRGNSLVVAVYAVIIFFFIKLYGGFRVGYHKWGSVLYSGILSLLITNSITYLQASLLTRAMLDVRPMLLMSLVQGLFIMGWSLGAHTAYTRLFAPREILMVYGGKKSANSLYHKIATYPENFVIKEAVDVKIGWDKLLDRVEKYKNVILCDISTSQRNRLFKFCYEQGIRTYTTPKISDILMRGATEVDLFDTPLLLNRNSGLLLEQRFAKRVIDIVLSFIALVVTLPLMLIISLAIKLYDRGPVLYRQKRLTQGHRIFTLYKFRSMIVDAEKHSGAQLATENDKRITPVGRVIRAVRLDELPQLFNILLNHMSIVGPRPERPEIARQYQNTIPEFQYRLRVKAGLTGLAQTVGRYNTTPYDKLRLDLIYIANYSLLQDFNLMFATAKILLTGNKIKKASGEGKEKIPELVVK